jgi:hypothetical protein
MLYALTSFPGIFTECSTHHAVRIRPGRNIEKIPSNQKVNHGNKLFQGTPLAGMDWSITPPPRIE